ncbi:hypothetical protein MRX96_051378 [Rhipicephalus microplus]
MSAVTLALPIRSSNSERRQRDSCTATVTSTERPSRYGDMDINLCGLRDVVLRPHTETESQLSPSQKKRKNKRRYCDSEKVAQRGRLGRQPGNAPVALFRTRRKETE